MKVNEEKNSGVQKSETGGELKAAPLCSLHQRLDDANSLVVEYGNGCLACSLNERTELLELLAHYLPEGQAAPDSVTFLRRLFDKVKALEADRTDLMTACKRLLKFNEMLCVEVGASKHYPSAEFARAVLDKATGEQQ